MDKQERGEEITPWLQTRVLEELSSEQEATFSYEGTIRATVLENPYAKIRFPADLLVGPKEQRTRCRSAPAIMPDDLQFQKSVERSRKGSSLKD